MCSSIERNRLTSKKSPWDRYKKIQFDCFYWLSSDFLTHIIVPKSAEKTQTNQYWPGPNAAEVSVVVVDLQSGCGDLSRAFA